MATYVLPELPYDVSALEPFISQKVMELHHDRHHAAYVAGANAALEGLAAARDAQDANRVGQHTRDLAFNLAGHVNHSIFWKNLSPDGGDGPTGGLGRNIDDDFGSLGHFKRQFGAVATGIQGSGWAMFAFDPLAQKTTILQLHDHQSGLAAGLIPLLMLDMWEHAYYLDYLNNKTDYVEAFWHVVNWDDVAERLADAKALACS